MDINGKKAEPMPRPVCGFGHDELVTMCLGIGCGFCDSYDEASVLFHRLRYEKESTKGIKALMEYREIRKTGPCPCVEHLKYEKCGNTSCRMAGWQKGYDDGYEKGKRA